jgi:hypothetical protein
MEDDHIISLILSYLYDLDLLHAASTCKRWMGLGLEIGAARYETREDGAYAVELVSAILSPQGYPLLPGTLANAVKKGRMGMVRYLINHPTRNLEEACVGREMSLAEYCLTPLPVSPGTDGITRDLHRDMLMHVMRLGEIEARLEVIRYCLKESKKGREISAPLCMDELEWMLGHGARREDLRGWGYDIGSRMMRVRCGDEMSSLLRTMFPPSGRPYPHLPSPPLFPFFRAVFADKGIRGLHTAARLILETGIILREDIDMERLVKLVSAVLCIEGRRALGRHEDFSEEAVSLLTSMCTHWQRHMGREEDVGAFVRTIVTGIMTSCHKDVRKAAKDFFCLSGRAAARIFL